MELHENATKSFACHSTLSRYDTVSTFSSLTQQVSTRICFQSSFNTPLVHVPHSMNRIALQIVGRGVEGEQQRDGRPVAAEGMVEPRTHQMVIEEFCQIGRLEIKFGRLEII